MNTPSHRSHHAAALILKLRLALSAVGAELTDATSSLFSGSANCAFCHDRWGRGLTDQQGRDVSIGTDWRATMMAHSFKDPLWRAVMESEVGLYSAADKTPETVQRLRVTLCGGT